MEKTKLLKVSRLSALTDGIFAIAMTILILGVAIPKGLMVQDLSYRLITDIFNKLLIYAGSFIILGTLWVGTNFQQGFLVRLTRPYLWGYIIFLMFVCVIPFSASLLAAYPNRAVSVTFYAINLICTSFLQLVTWHTAYRWKLIGMSCTEPLRLAIRQRILIAPLFYSLALIVAHWNTAIAFALLIAPIIIHIIPGAIDRYIEK